MSIKDIINGLTPQDREALMTAFEVRAPFHIEYEPGRFVGVNTDENPRLVTEAVAGHFRCGRIRGHDASTAEGD